MREIVRFMAAERRIRTVQTMLDMGAIDEQRAEALLRDPDGTDLTDRLIKRASGEGKISPAAGTKKG